MTTEDQIKEISQLLSDHHKRGLLVFRTFESLKSWHTENRQILIALGNKFSMPLFEWRGSNQSNITSIVCIDSMSLYKLLGHRFDKYWLIDEVPVHFEESIKMRLR